MRPRNRFSEISLAPPEPLQANFGAPQMQFNVPEMEGPDTGGQIEGIGKSLLRLRKKPRFTDEQSAGIEGALSGISAGFA